MSEETKTSSTSAEVGCMFGICSSVLSYALNHSMGWAIFHFFCSYLYIAYAVIFRAREIGPAIRAHFGF